MKNGLLIVERIVVESLSKKEKNLKELEIDTNLEHGLLLNIIPNLMMQNIVLYNKGIYSLEKEQSFLWLKSVNDKENIKEEVKELFVSLVNQYFKKDLAENKAQTPHLKVQKMWLTRDEEIILKSHMATLEGFFQGIKDARLKNPIKGKTCEERVVIWGFSQYSDLVEGILKAV